MLTRGFVISTIAIPVLIIGFIVFQFAAAGKETVRTRQVAIVDQAGGMGAVAARSLAGNTLPGGEPAFNVVEVLERPSHPDQVRERLTSMMRARALNGYLWVPSGVLAGDAPVFVGRDPAGLRDAGALKRAVAVAELAERLRSRGISAKDAEGLLREPELRLVRLTREGQAEDKAQVYLVAIVMAMILYGALLTYGITTMRAVLEEKTSRIVEVLISSIRPIELLAGKVLGVAAVALTQFLIWAISAGLLAGYGASLEASHGGQSALALGLTPSVLVWTVIYFLGGYFFYSAFYVAIGAMVSNEHEAHQLQLPVTLLLAGSFLLFNVIIHDPSSPAAVALSIVPFFSPILMVMRIALQAPPPWQVAASLAVLVLSTIGVIYASARIYRAGILMYGKRPSLVELIRWLRAS